MVCRTYLRDAELTCSKLFLVLIHFLIALRLGALQLLAALHHALHLRFHLADVQSGHCELFVNHATHFRLLTGESRCEIFGYCLAEVTLFWTNGSTSSFLENAY